MTLLQELTETIRVLDAAIPANPESERNLRLADALERDIARYFRDLLAAVDWDAVERVYYDNVEAE